MKVNLEFTVLVTVDGKSVYKSTPYNYGIEVINLWIEKQPQTLHPRFSSEFDFESTKIILANNNGTFNNEFYKQISGTAMNTIFLPKYATLTIGYFEVHLYDTCEVKWGSEFEEFLIEYGSIFLYDYKILLDREKVQPQNY